MWAISGEGRREWLMLRLFHKSVFAVPFISDQFHSLGIICQEPVNFFFTGRGKCGAVVVSIYATTTASLLFALHFTIGILTWLVKPCGAFWCLSSEVTLQVWAGLALERSFLISYWWLHVHVSVFIVCRLLIELNHDSVHFGWCILICDEPRSRRVTASWFVFLNVNE